MFSHSRLLWSQKANGVAYSVFSRPKYQCSSSKSSSYPPSFGLTQASTFSTSSPSVDPSDKIQTSTGTSPKQTHVPVESTQRFLSLSDMTLTFKIPSFLKIFRASDLASNSQTLLQMMAPPHVEPYLHASLQTMAGPISIDYASHPVRKRILHHSVGAPVVLYGPSNVGKSTFIQSVIKDLQKANEYAVYVPLRASGDMTADEFIDSRLDPNPNVIIYSSTSIKPRSKRERIDNLLAFHASRGSPVSVFIDDAQHLKKDSPCLGPLLEYVLGGKLRLVFITGTDDETPEFLKSSGYSERYFSFRFEQDPELVMDALRKIDRSADEVQLIVNNVGFSVGDIGRVLSLVNCDENLKMQAAIDMVLSKMAAKIVSEVTKIALSHPNGEDAFLLRREAIQLLSTLQTDPKHAVYIDEFASDAQRYVRLEFLAEKLTDANILSRVSADKYVWRKYGYAKAFAKYVSSQQADEPVKKE